MLSADHLVLFQLISAANYYIGVVCAALMFHCVKMVVYSPFDSPVGSQIDRLQRTVCSFCW